MTESTKIAIGCCNRLLQDAIARILAKKAEFSVLSSVPASSVSLDELAETGADVLVLDSLATFFATSSESDNATVRARKCVLVAMEDDHANFLKAIERGALGYVLREASAMDVVSAIRAVAQGQAACPTQYTRVLFDHVAACPAKATAADRASGWGLTRRERELIPLLLRNQTNKEIASHLHLSEQTIKNHIHRMMRKMQASSRLEICEVWQRQGDTSTTSGRYFEPYESARPIDGTEY